ncbi:polysaccharide deacetylase family protein, partial [Candidatus Auribacterota bacterium]
HFRLSTFDERAFETEIICSKNEIEKKTGKTVDFISYPFGTIFDLSEKWKEYIKDSGYKCGFVAMFGWNRYSTDRYKLRRIGIEGSDTIFTLRAKLNGALDPFFAIAETATGRTIIRFINKITGTLDYK